MRRALLSSIVLGGVIWAGQGLHQFRPEINFFSPQQDIQTGRQMAAQVERRVALVRAQSVNAYVARIGRRLAAQPGAGGFPYSFKVTADNSVNAFSLPGGPVYVNRGLIRAVDNEAQLAGVLAHEIAHVALRHATNQASKSELIQIPARIAGGLLGGHGALARWALSGLGLGANSVLLKFSRDAERDADLLGARLMAEAGYNPIEMARFFEKLQGRGGGGWQFLSDHPNPGHRVQAVAGEIGTFPHHGYTTGNAAALRAIQRRL